MKLAKLFSTVIAACMIAIAPPALATEDEWINLGTAPNNGTVLLNLTQTRRIADEQRRGYVILFGLLNVRGKPPFSKGYYYVGLVDCSIRMFTYRTMNHGNQVIYDVGVVWHTPPQDSVEHLLVDWVCRNLN